MSKTNDTESISSRVVEAIPKLIGILNPLPPEDRQRAISAVMVLFGKSPNSQGASPQQTNIDDTVENTEGISPKAAVWIKKNGISREQLDHVFSIDNQNVEVIAARMPENGKRKQTVQAYVICGFAAFLKTGETSFTDADGRALCIKLGCYDIANHANYTKGAFGNLVTGSKDSGWKLTNPGLVQGAQIVKQLQPEATT